MQKPIRLFWAFVLVQAFWVAAPAHSQILQYLIENEAHDMPNSKVWGKTSFNDVTLELHYRSSVRPTSLLVGRDNPNGIKFLAMFPGYAASLPLQFPEEFEGIDEFGELNEGYYVQVAEHDFDRDGTPEIVVAVGNGSFDLVVNVVKYHAPESMKDAGRVENWSLVGSFAGQEKALIHGDTISLPFGSQGLYNEYTWVKQKFIESN